MEEYKTIRINRALALLEYRKIKYETLNKITGHYRVEGWDFWPSTGRFYHQRTKEGGCGVYNLIKRIKDYRDIEKEKRGNFIIVLCKKIGIARLVKWLNNKLKK